MVKRLAVDLKDILKRHRGVQFTKSLYIQYSNQGRAVREDCPPRQEACQSGNGAACYAVVGVKPA